MAQAVRPRSLNAEARVRKRFSPSEICCKQSGNGTVFLRFLRLFPVNIIPPWLTILLHHQGMDNTPVSGRISET
jgi:hypothetical protein